MKKNILLIIVLSLFISLLLTGLSVAATYNFYFNGTEQGDNSTANPTVTVNQDGQEPAKVTKPNTDTTSTQSSVTEVPYEEIETTTRTPRFRIAGGLLGSVNRRWDNSGDSYGYSHSGPSLGGILETGIYLSKYFVINGFIGYLPGDITKNSIGLEIEAIPFEVSVYKKEITLDLAGLLGASSNLEEVVPIFHGGARATLNFARKIESNVITQKFGIYTGCRISSENIQLLAGLSLQL